MLAGDHNVHWACTALRQVLASLSAGLAPHRHVSQVEHVVSWLEQARASTGRYRPTLSVGRDGLFVPLQHRVWQEGATATVSVLDRRGKRVGPGYLGHMPEPGQGTVTAQLSALLHDILSRVDSYGLRLVYVTDDGYHPSDYDQSVLRQMSDPRRPWCCLDWIRIIAYYHACHYVQQLADAICGPGTESQGWAKRMREQLKPKAHGVTRVLQSASALRRKCGLRGQTTLDAQACASSPQAQSVDAVSVLQEAAFAHRQWDHRGGLQNGLHAATQALGDVVDDYWRPSHPGPPRHLAQWRLG
jgi:hypothetical protein